MRYYPQLLVTAQFLLIIAIVVLSIRQFHLNIVGVVCIVAGLWLGSKAVRHHPKHNFNIVPELKEGCQLVTQGPYRYIRHPMYSAVMLLTGGIALCGNSHTLWLLWLLLWGVLFLKAHREERLWLQHDTCYATYKEQTAYFIPYLF